VLDLLLQYGLFLAKTMTVVVAALIVIVAVSNIGNRRRHPDEGHVDVLRLNDRFEDDADELRAAVLDKAALKAHQKAEKRSRRQRKRAMPSAGRVSMCSISMATSGPRPWSRCAARSRPYSRWPSLSMTRLSSIWKAGRHGAQLWPGGLAAARIRQQQSPTAHREAETAKAHRG